MFHESGALNSLQFGSMPGATTLTRRFMLGMLYMRTLSHPLSLSFSLSLSRLISARNTLVQARMNLAACRVQNTVIAAGGSIAGLPVGTIDRFDSEYGVWTSQTLTVLSLPRSGTVPRLSSDMRMNHGRSTNHPMRHCKHV